ncbi:uncharacterized protein N7479_009861 [Penicillium vulpinum]|uniref:Shugoshin C-terminal domain-containing protein n=1 Tax=Penicillium vulpinum TaxID=29845 RepID=A0A1V6RXU2_9EURO|nr:uncharacterized protein N7479_009861 [Penicillium vulpinum]KAJ5951448.1 hypothetical protein N7479_009861 [Penicillium vulpinum]OQE06591.1 hypothetical protein PENVUL_c017G09284 [Penicillium vulpinum]
MARLNDYAAPAESIEALKRRFVRQNREIARVNSLQSLRIRSLESEVSHLLSENVSLRKQVINLTQETERLEAGKMLQSGIYDIKSKLDAKLAELSSLAADLGSLPRNVTKICGEQFDRPKQAPESRPRTEDMMEGEDGRLPAIVEDKYYPRRTLEPQELDSLVQSDHSILDSPPQFTFMPEEGDALIENSSPSPPESTFKNHLNSDIPEEPEPILPPTLETRKKKKKSSSIIAPEISPAPIDRQPSPPIDTTQHAPLVSTKRKYIPEDDDRFTSNLNADDDEFQFTRPSHSPKKQMNPFEDTQRDQSPAKSHVDVTRGSKTPVLAMRRVLEPKSANSNLASPKKARMSSYADSKLLQRPTKGDENTNSPQKVTDVEKLSGKTINQKPRVSKIAPSSKEKRASRPAPPQLEEPAPRQPALSPHPNVMKTEEESTTRPSRRRGAVVSYAEPNLRDKMRRPTKELIDAVALGSRRSSSFQTGRDSLDGGEGGLTQSHGSLPADFTLAARSSELSSADGSSEQLLSMVSRRKRKVSSAPQDDSNAGNPSSGLQKEIEDSLADISAQVSQEPLNSRRQPRRHSSNPKSATANTAQYEVDQAEPQSPIGDSPEDEDSFGPGPNGSTMDTSHVKRGQRVAARRKSMMV